MYQKIKNVCFSENVGEQPLKRRLKNFIKASVFKTSNFIFKGEQHKTNKSQCVCVFFSSLQQLFFLPLLVHISALFFILMLFSKQTRRCLGWVPKLAPLWHALRGHTWRGTHVCKMRNALTEMTIADMDFVTIPPVIYLVSVTTALFLSG